MQTTALRTKEINQNWIPTNYGKVKEVRQDYRKAVASGRRSGCGKLICENWDTLKTLWGGSPATCLGINLKHSYRIFVLDMISKFFSARAKIEKKIKLFSPG